MVPKRVTFGEPVLRLSPFALSRKDLLVRLPGDTSSQISRRPDYSFRSGEPRGFESCAGPFALHSRNLLWSPDGNHSGTKVVVTDRKLGMGNQEPGN